MNWNFTTGELLENEPWYVPPRHVGTVLACGIPDSPNEDLNTLQNTILRAISAVRQSLAIVTPYFVPDATLISALNTAAYCGVSVDILLSERSNLQLAQWASTAQLWQVLQGDCRRRHSITASC